MNIIQSKIENSLREKLKFDIKEKVFLNVEVFVNLELEEEQQIVVKLQTCYNVPLTLHWGVGFKSAKDWNFPPQTLHPDKTIVFDKKSVQSKFQIEKETQLITLVFPKSGELYRYLNFVLKETNSNVWFNNNSKDYSIKLFTPPVIVSTSETEIPEFVNCIIDNEVNKNSWTLMHRFNKVYEIIESMDQQNIDYLIWIFVWLRYSTIRQLTWQKNYNTKPRELSHSMSRLTNLITKKFAETFDNNGRDNFWTVHDVYRLILSQLGKGTGDGQKIRDEILQIMHKNHIKETNDHFYEQWHQKLHNNTTPDDIVICQAIITYLKSGNLSDYWSELEKGGVTKERLASFERKIVSEPYHNASYIPDLEKFLITLKNVHSSSDLTTMIEQARYILGSYSEKFNEILKFKNDWDTLKQISRVTEARQIILNSLFKNNLNQHDKLRDLIFLDMGLEVYLRQIIEKIIHIKTLKFEDYIYQISLILNNIGFSYKYNEIHCVLEDWIKIVEPLKSILNVTNALKIKSVADRASRTIGHIIDEYHNKVEFKGKFLGNSFNADKYAVDLFTEECIRGSIFFSLSVIIKKIEITLRNEAMLGPWQVISPGNLITQGYVEYEKDLKGVQYKVYNKKTILLTQIVGGNEEIPMNVVGLIIIFSRDYPDILAHVSVRARNLKVLFSVCFDDSVCSNLEKTKGKSIQLQISKNNHIEFKEIDKVEITTEKKIKYQMQSISLNKELPMIYLDIDDFNKDLVGAKSFNILKINKNISKWIKVPESFAIPYNVQEYIMDFVCNQPIKERIRTIISDLNIDIISDDTKFKISEKLKLAKEEVMKLNWEENDMTLKLKKKFIEFGIKGEDFNLAFNALKSVFGSKYNERVFLSLNKIGLKIDHIRMAVLVQKVIPADFAFVIHTKNPLNNDDSELYAEVVHGMGETLVGFYEGQSFSFSVKKADSSCFKVYSYPNKSISLRSSTSGFIFRSDSNSEDLEDFAGAGLFDSITIRELEKVNMSYYKSELFKDNNFVKNMVKNITKLGLEVEGIYNFPQDIEGVIYKDNYYIVQSRPQA